MRRARIRTVLLLAAALSLPGGSRAQEPALPDLEERMFIATKLHTAIRIYFAHWEGVPELDLDAAYREYVGEVIGARDRKAWSLAGMKFFAKLKNSHSWFFDNALRAELGRDLGFRLRHLQGEWVVTESRIEGLEPGDVVTAIDGRDFKSFYQEKRQYIMASTEPYARLTFTRDFYAGWLFPTRFTLETGDRETISIDRTGEYEPVSAGETEGRWQVEGRVGYIRIPSFNAPRFQEDALEHLDRFRSAEALVIDVRGNRGGTTPGRLTRALMDRPYRWYAEATPFHLGTAGGSAQRYHLGWSASESRPDSAAYAGEIVILIDAGCHSACEDFIVPFKDNGRATLVGETSAGSSGQPYFASFDGVSVGIGAKREMFPDGSTFEGVGVAPDVPLLPAAEDYRAGRDPALERALEILDGG